MVVEYPFHTPGPHQKVAWLVPRTEKGQSPRRAQAPGQGGTDSLCANSLGILHMGSFCHVLHQFLLTLSLPHKHWKATKYVLLFF